jgi:L-ascorbate metabolism protein UlaG (beta-lactamase superfamily)
VSVCRLRERLGSLTGGLLTYVGHATTLIEVDGTRLLTDPVLRARVAHCRRLVAVSPFEPRLDAILVSHAHYDHLDLPSLRDLPTGVPVIAPHGVARLIRRRTDHDAIAVAPGDRVRVGNVDVVVTEAVPSKTSVSPAKYLGDEGGVGGRVEPHEHQVVALGDDVLVDLLGSLGGHQHVDPELAALPRDAHGVLGRERGQHVGRRRGAHVVGLVDDHEDRTPLAAALPHAAEHALRDQCLLSAGRQRPGVDDEAAHRRVVERLEQGAGVGARPDTQALEAQVGDPEPETPELGAVRRRELLEALGPRLDEQGAQLRVLLAVGDGVELQQRRLGGGRELAEAQPQPPVSADVCRVHPDAAVEDHAVPAGQPDPQARPDLGVVVTRQPHLAEVGLGDLERPHLTQLRSAVALEHHVAAEPQVEPVDPRLEGEAAPVERRDLALHRSASRARCRARRTAAATATRSSCASPARR